MSKMPHIMQVRQPLLFAAAGAAPWDGSRRVWWLQWLGSLLLAG
jgi:hypothetical protein